MKESLKKPLLFAVIVVIGSVLVLFDIPLVILLPVIIVVGFGTLLAVGSITIAEIRNGIAGLGKTGILKRLNDIKFFEKKTADTKKAPAPVPAKKEAVKEKKKDDGAKPGIAAHLSTFVSSVRSLGSMLRQKNRQGKKVEDINTLLDKTVSEKVPAPSPVTAPAVPAGGSGGAAGPLKAPDTDDPFMSLSGDEFDEGLLDGLGGDDGLVTPFTETETVPDAGGVPDAAAGGPEPAMPEPDISAAAGDILKEAGGDLGEFAGLDGEDLSDTDFGDLDNLSLDDVDLDTEAGDVTATAPPDASPAPAAPAAAPASDSTAVKTAWIPSDAPKDAGEEAAAEDEISTQADMAAFAGGQGGDEDLLSSIASDVKHVKKEQDLSLLRELKDFRAPADEIEKELGGMFERLNQAQQTKRKNPPDKKKIK